MRAAALAETEKMRIGLGELKVWRIVGFRRIRSKRLGTICACPPLVADTSAPTRVHQSISESLTPHTGRNRRTLIIAVNNIITTIIIITIPTQIVITIGVLVIITCIITTVIILIITIIIIITAIASINISIIIIIIIIIIITIMIILIIITSPTEEIPMSVLQSNRWRCGKLSNAFFLLGSWDVSC
ncbi:hypothetical protein AK812_SmicGene38694 [Symbiodinium microadriaticum]|uniref:Uncharacterized protein n=1 Tax=Symbiodinium microadriaticum TaxID=2951 RepID=A0A1Q9CD49_SYMMI|nr:hypothetical protein AK812_SmicGene38694 [Symbiodinium microadriaticum]